MRVLLFGGTGFIGRHVVHTLQTAGHDAVILTRGASHGESPIPLLHYSLDDIQAVFPRAPEPYAIVNLAGESINSGRWTTERKRRILDSRIQLTTAIVDAILSASHPPEALINASAIGYYGYSETSIVDESTGRGNGFLADVTSRWEEAANLAAKRTRVVLARFGVVLGRDGGALPQMAMPYRFWAGGRVGKGSQWVSWVHVSDAARMVAAAVTDTALSGPLNVTAPNPVPMDEFGKILGQVMHRPHYLPVPEFALKALFGEMSEILLQGQRVLPAKWTRSGHDFLYPDLKAALADLC